MFLSQEDCVVFQLYLGQYYWEKDYRFEDKVVLTGKALL